MNARCRRRTQLGTLLLDSLTATAILAVLFALTYPNYQRAIYQAEVSSEAAQMQLLAAVTVEYSNDHHGIYPPSASYQRLTTDFNGSSYIATVPTPTMNSAGDFSFSPNGDDGAAYEIYDTTAIGSDQAPPAYDLSYFVNGYTRHDGTSCQDGDYFAIDNVHGLHCAQPGH